MTSNKEHYLKTELDYLIKTDSTIFEFLQKGVLDGLWYWDLEHPENEWMSPEFWKLLGYQPSEMKHLASEWQDIIDPDDKLIALDNLRKHCADPNHPYDQIVRYRHRTGSSIWVRCRGIAIRNSSGRPIRLLGIHTDVTALMRANQETQQEREAKQEIERLLLAKEESETRMNLAQEVARFGTFDWNIQTGINIWSSKLAALYGLSPGNFAGTQEAWENLVHPEDRSKAIGFVNQAFQSNRPVSGEWRVTWPDGSLHWLEGRFQVLRDSNGKPIHLIGVNLDITERKHLEDELRTAVQLRDEFLSIASHELKTPLTAL